MKELLYSYNAIKIQKHLIDLFYKQKINLKINNIVTNNNVNIKKVYNNLKISEKISYTTYILQLSIRKRLDTIRTLINKCKYLITFLAIDKKK